MPDALRDAALLALQCLQGRTVPRQQVIDTLRAALDAPAAPQAEPGRVPLTDEQIAAAIGDTRMSRNGWPAPSALRELARCIERAHGITGEPQPSQPVTLPAPPEPEALGVDFDEGWDGVRSYCYTADQMTAYARAALAAAGVSVTPNTGD